jgi:hypothetical protein
LHTLFAENLRKIPCTFPTERRQIPIPVAEIFSKAPTFPKIGIKIAPIVLIDAEMRLKKYLNSRKLVLVLVKHKQVNITHNIDNSLKIKYN